jgi:CO/xanthine dehydrogenase Mo-binding subunit
MAEREFLLWVRMFSAAKAFGRRLDGDYAMPAALASLRVDRSNGHVAVEKLTLVVDAGTFIHPDNTAAQAEGAALGGGFRPHV